MVESTINPATYSTEILDSSGNGTGVYVYLDYVNTEGQARILIFRNITTESRQHDFDDSATTFYKYLQNVISWSLPGSYTKDGTTVEIGTDEIVTGEDGAQTTVRKITKTEVQAYVEANASEIAGFSKQTKIQFIQ